MREDCRHFQSRTYDTGEVARFCVLNLAPEAPWRCPDNCDRYQPDLIDGSFVVGSLVRPPVESEPDEPEDSVSTLLDEANSIVTAAGPEIAGGGPKVIRRRRYWWGRMGGAATAHGWAFGLEQALTTRRVAGTPRLPGSSPPPRPLSSRMASARRLLRPKPPFELPYHLSLPRPNPATDDDLCPLPTPWTRHLESRTHSPNSVAAPGPRCQRCWPRGPQELDSRGHRIAASGTTTATVWTSPDGRSWTAAALSDLDTSAGASPGIASSTAADAASQWRDTTVIVGSLTTPSGTRAAAWVSDGVDRALQAGRDPVPAEDSEMNMVTAGPLGLFAAGTVDGSFAMWSSTDGAMWTESPAAAKTIDASPSAQVNSLLAEGGSVYTAGSVRDGTSTDAALWSSSDGIAWRQVVNDRPAFSGAGGDRAIESLAPLQTGVVAVGAQRVGDRYEPVSWISPDGVSWSAPSSGFATSAPGQAVDLQDDEIARSVSSYLSPAGSTALIAVGGSAKSQRVWRSTDGIHWDAMALPAGAAASVGWRVTMAATGADSALVGDGDWGQPHLLSLSGSEWTEPSANPNTFGPVQPVADGTSANTTAAGITIAVDITQDPQALAGSVTVAHYALVQEGATPAGGPTGEGAAWTAFPATPSPARVPTGTTSVTRWGAGWLAVGTASSGSGVVWTSTDGHTWTADATLAAAAGQLAVPLGACSTSRMVVAVGTSFPVPTISEGVGSRTNINSAPTTSIPPSPFTPRRAIAWSGASAQTMRVSLSSSPAGGPGDEGMVGCVAQSTGFVAFGATSNPSGGLVPAIWRSSRGRSWIRQPSDGFTADSTGALDALAVHGSISVAVAGTSTVASLSDGSDFGAEPRSGLTEGVWVSAAASAPWVLVDTAHGSWVGNGPTDVALAGFVGGAPLVVGTLGNGLAVWSGSAKQTLPPPSSVSSSTAGS